MGRFVDVLRVDLSVTSATDQAETYVISLGIRLLSGRSWGGKGTVAWGRKRLHMSYKR